MKIINNELDIRDFKAWSGAVETKEKIIEEGKAQEFNELIEGLYPDGLSDTKLNDILWFEYDWIFESLGIEKEYEN